MLTPSQRDARSQLLARTALLSLLGTAVCLVVLGILYAVEALKPTPATFLAEGSLQTVLCLVGLVGPRLLRGSDV